MDEKWQKFDVSKTKRAKPASKTGRPLTARMPKREREEIKNQIEEAYGSLTKFYGEAFDEAIKPGYALYRPPADIETVKSAFANFFNGKRPLPKIYQKVLGYILGLIVENQTRRDAALASPDLGGEALTNPARRVAYVFYVDITNRKVALPMDWDNDTLIEVYASWKVCFDNSITLLKELPVEHTTEAKAVTEIIRQVLHGVLRPHLTRWQAMYRKWHEINSRSKKYQGLRPQDVQRQFPQFAALRADFDTAQSKMTEYVHKLETWIYPRTR